MMHIMSLVGKGLIIPYERVRLSDETPSINLPRSLAAFINTFYSYSDQLESLGINEARLNTGSPTPSVPTSLSTSFYNFSPVLPSKEQDASPTESLQTPGDHTPGTQLHPPSSSSPLSPSLPMPRNEQTSSSVGAPPINFCHYSSSISASIEDSSLVF